MLADAGLTINEDGTLSLDSSTFETALENDTTSVAALFTDNPTTDAPGTMTNIANAIQNMTTGGGSIAADIQGFGDQSTTMGNDITNMQTQLTQEQANLQTQFTNMEMIVEQYKTMSSAVSAISTTA
jgi:flagellar hook-associated protein 2